MSSGVPTFFPSAFFAGIVRLDSPGPHNTSVYEHDRKYFAHHKRRKMYLRSIWPEEFGTPSTYYARSVQIEVWVKQLAQGVHEIMPVWVSKSSIEQNQTTDSEVLNTVLEMQRLGGLNSVVWDEFKHSWNEYLKATRLPANCEAIQ